MARTNNLTNFLTDVAGAIKTKKGSQTAIQAANFDTEILALPSQGTYQEKTVTITQNGQTTLTPDTGYDAMDQVEITVNVPIKQLQSKTVSVTSNGNVSLLPDSGYDGFNEVSLNVNVDPNAVNYQIYTAAYIGQDSTVQRDVVQYSNYKQIEIDLLPYINRTIIITNTGDRNFYGFTSVKPEDEVALNNSRQSASGGLTYKYTGGNDRYLVYDFTASNQADSVISVRLASVELIEKNITTNGVYNAEDDSADGFSKVTVNVPSSQINNQDKTITQNGTYTADSGYTGLGEVTVNVPSGSGDVKLFETEQAMQADPNPTDGGLAVVYRNELEGITEDSEFSSCIFPNEVVLDEAFTGNVGARFRQVDDGYFDGLINMSSTVFIFQGYGESSEIRVQYTSSDGITYTRTDGGEELQEFGTTIKWESWGGPFNDVLGNFMKIGEKYFGGLYQYQSYSSTSLIEGLTNVVSSSSYQTSTVEISDIQRVVELVEDKFDTDIGLGNHPSRRYIIVKINNTYRVYFGIYIDSTYGNIESPIGLLFADNKSYVTFGPSHTGTDILITDNLANTNGTTYKPYCYDVDITNETVTDTQLLTSSFTQTTVSSKIKMKGPELTNLGVIVQYNMSNEGSIAYNVGYITSSGSSGTIKNVSTTVMDYLLADTQLDAIPESVYEKTFYGKNGVETGILGTPDNSFADTSAAVYTKVKKSYDVMTPRVLTDSDKDINKNIYIVPSKANGVSLLDTSGVTNMNSLFQDCKNLIEVSSLNTSNVISMHSMFFGCTSLITIPQLNTSNVTNMTQMFYECSSLVTIPLLDTSNVTTMNYMFIGCTSLTTIPQLDTSSVTNIFGMFSGCTSLTTIPLLDISNATSMNYMFSNCTSLSNESLNNILAMCTNATSYTGTKTLKYIGINATQATTCQSLSNYSAFTSAGWTTGY